MSKAEIIRLMYRTRFAQFAEAAFEAIHPGEALIRNWHIDVVVHALNTFMTGDTYRLVVNLPPRSLKSFMTSIAMPAFLMGRDHRRKILILAGTPDLATELRTKIARLMRSHRYRSIFPGIEFREDGRTLLFADGGALSVLRYGEAIIGKGFDFIVIDDPQSPSQAEDADKRRQVVQYYNSDVQPRLNSRASGRVAVVQQRLHAHDLSGSLPSDEWERLVIPAMSSQAETWVTAHGRVARAKWTALFEAREDAASLRSLLHTMGARRFAAQYLQAPYPDGDGEVDRVAFMWQRPPETWDQSEQMPCAFARARKIDTLVERYFGGPQFRYVATNPNRGLTLEEWSDRAQKHQAALVRRAQQ